MERIQCNRLLTLTYKMPSGTTADEALCTIRAAWVRFRKSLARLHQRTSVPYVLIVEFTQANAPHLHILLNCPYTPQHWCSHTWNALTGSPIVDIRTVQSTEQAAKYLTNYLSKQTYMPAHNHKYSAARGVLPPPLPYIYEPDEEEPTYTYAPAQPWRYVQSYLLSGWKLYEDGPDSLLLIPAWLPSNPPALSDTS